MRRLADKKNNISQDYLNDSETISDAESNDLMTTLDESGDISGKGRGNQGFASMSKEKQREIASKGGKAAHEAGTAHEWDSEEAAAAGRRGGQKKVV